MTTIAVTGKLGFTSLGGECRDIDITVSMDSHEATSMGADHSNGHKEFIGGLQGASGTLNTLVPLGDIGAQTAITFTATSGKSVTGNIIITDIGIPVQTEDLVVFPYSFVFNGPVTGVGVYTG